VALSSGTNQEIVRRMRTVLRMLEKYELKEKSNNVKDWNDIIHELHDLLQNYESNLPSQLRDNFQSFMNYTEAPDIELPPDQNSLKSNLENTIDLFEQAKEIRTNFSPTTIIGIAIAVVIVSAAIISFYLTQYAITRLEIVNNDCEPIQFQDQQQVFKLVRIPESPITKGGYAIAQVPAGTLSINSISEERIELGYTFGLSMSLNLPSGVSDITLNNLNSILGKQVTIDVPKDGENIITIMCR